MAILDKKSVLAAKIESTPGTAIALAASDGNMNVFNKRLLDNTEFIERMGQSAFSRITGSLGARGGQVTFETDLVPSSNDSMPTWASILLPACGYVATSTTYAPTTEAPGSNVKTLTIGLYTDGLFERLHGCAGTFSISCLAGQPGRISWTFTGCYDEPTDVSLITPTYPTLNPMRFISSALLIGSYTPKIQGLTFDAGNVVTLLEDSRTATGYSHAIITDRRPTFTINPETALVATADYWGDFTDRTERALSMQFAEGGLSFVIEAPKIQLAGPPSASERGGVRVSDLVFQCNRSAAGGDDEVNLTFDNTV